MRDYTEKLSKALAQDPNIESIVSISASLKIMKD